MQAWIAQYAHGTVVWDDFHVFFDEYFDKIDAVRPRLSQVPWVAWLNDRDPQGNPVDVLSLCDDDLVMSAVDLANRWISSTESTVFAKEELAAFDSQRKLIFLNRLSRADPPISLATLERIDALYNLTALAHMDIRLKWLSLGLTLKREASFRGACDMVASIGRMKYVRPLYKLMHAMDEAATKAFFATHSGIYHPICAKLVARDLGVQL